MNIHTAFPSQWLKASDLDGKEFGVTIREVRLEEVGQDDKKPVLYFREGKKGMVLNKTNAETIAWLYGEETDHWPGKELILFSERTSYMGKPVLGLRVRGHSTGQPTAPGAFPGNAAEAQDASQRGPGEQAAHRSTQEDAGLDDSIPF